MVISAAEFTYKFHSDPLTVHRKPPRRYYKDLLKQTILQVTRLEEEFHQLETKRTSSFQQ